MSSRTDEAVKVRRRVSEQKRHAVLDAAQMLLDRGQHPSLAAIARAAGTSENFIHSQNNRDLKAQVDALIDEARQRAVSGRATHSNVTVASLRAELENERAARRRDVDRTRALERRLSEAFGTELNDALPVADGGHDAGQLQDRVAELEEREREMVLALRETEEERDAARRAHRQLMRDRNITAGPA